MAIPSPVILAPAAPAVPTPSAAPPVAPEGELAGLRIGVLKRLSTSRQIGNWSDKEQDTRLADKISRLGATPIIYDETDGKLGKRGMSGRNLAKRLVALQLLADIDAGHLDGMAGWDIKRVTRDPFLRDGGVIANRLADRRAVLVTMGRIYRPWLKDDLFVFNMESTVAGRDVLDIRDTMYRGVFGRGLREPFFMGIPPLGYRVRVIEERRAAGATVYTRRLPEKHPDEDALMRDLITWLNECQSAGHVTANMTRKYGEYLAQRTIRNRKLAAWAPRNITRMLANPTYWGEWVFGRVTRYVDQKKYAPRSNPVWDTDRRRERGAEFRHVLDGSGQCPCGSDHHECGDLRYWSRAQAQAWLAKFQPTDRTPRVRKRTYDHPLLGIFVCTGCGFPLVGYGRLGYGCSNRDSGACRHPQIIGEKAARAVLRILLPEALPKAAQLKEEALRHERAQCSGETVQALRNQKRHYDELLQQATADLYSTSDRSQAERAAIRAQMTEFGRQSDRLAAEVDAAETRQELDAAARERVALLAAMPLQAFDQPAISDDERAAIYRFLFRDVRVQAAGSGPGRHHWVAPGDYAINPQVSDPTAWNALAYLGTHK